MEETTYLIFTTPSCGKCQIIKKHFETKDVGDKVLFIIASEPDGNKLAVKYGVRSLPTLIGYVGESVSTCILGDPYDIIAIINDLIEKRHKSSVQP